MAPLEGGGEVLEEDHGVVLLEVFDQPPPLLGGQAGVQRDVVQQLLEAPQGGGVSLVLVLLWGHLLAEGEHGYGVWVSALLQALQCPPHSLNQGHGRLEELRVVVQEEEEQPLALRAAQLLVLDHALLDRSADEGPVLGL